MPGRWSARHASTASGCSRARKASTKGAAHAYSRFQRLLIRLYEEEEDLSIYFILDTSRSMGFGDGEKLRQAKRLCAALA